MTPVPYADMSLPDPPPEGHMGPWFVASPGYQLVHFNEVMGFSGSSAGKKLTCNGGNPGSIP